MKDFLDSVLICFLVHPLSFLHSPTNVLTCSQTNALLQFLLLCKLRLQLTDNYQTTYLEVPNCNVWSSKQAIFFRNLKKNIYWWIFTGKIELWLKCAWTLTIRQSFNFFFHYITITGKCIVNWYWLNCLDWSLFVFGGFCHIVLVAILRNIVSIYHFYFVLFVNHEAGPGTMFTFCNWTV